MLRLQFLLQLPALCQQPGGSPQNSDGQQVTDQEIAGPRWAVETVRSQHQHRGECGDDVDVATPAPEEDDTNRDEEASQQRRVGNGEAYEEEQAGEHASEYQDEQRMEWVFAHIYMLVRQARLMAAADRQEYCDTGIH